jgi:hypothetical protein
VNSETNKKAIELLVKMTTGGFKPCEWVVEANVILSDEWEKDGKIWKDKYHPSCVTLRDHSVHSKKRRGNSRMNAGRLAHADEKLTDQKEAP